MENQNTNQSVKSIKHAHSQAPKVMFGFLIFLGLATFLLGAFSIFTNIYSPFLSIKNQSLDTTEETSTDDLINMQLQDTDGDGISDYDETYVYGTSIYLEDTDSDGYSDQQEVVAGYDPVCPAGKNCRDTSTTASDQGAPADDWVDPVDDTTTITPDFLSQLGGLSADELRQMILSSGEVSQEELDQIDDTTLLETFQEILNEQQ